MNKQAVTAQSLYLVNLLLLPGISFIALVFYFFKFKHVTGIARAHIYRAVQLSIIAGIVLILVPLFIYLSALKLELQLMVIIVFFVCFHALFILLGVINLSRAMAKKMPLF